MRDASAHVTVGSCAGGPTRDRDDTLWECLETGMRMHYRANAPPGSLNAANCLNKELTTLTQNFQMASVGHFESARRCIDPVPLKRRRIAGAIALGKVAFAQYCCVENSVILVGWEAWHCREEAASGSR